MHDASNYLIFAGLMMPILVLIGLAILAFEIWMLVDLIRNPELSDERKILWAVGMILIHPIIAIVYYFTDRKPKK